MNNTKAIELETMNADAWSVRYHNVADAELLATHALQLAEEAHNTFEQGIALRTLSYCHSVNGNYAEALLLGQQALDLLDSAEPAELAEATRIINRVHWNLGDYAAAMEFNLQTLELAKRGGERQLVAHTLLNSALTLVHLGRFDEVLPILDEAMAAFESLNDPRGMMKAYCNVAMLHLTENRLQDALDAAKKGWRLAASASMVDAQVELLDTLGQIYIAFGEYESALHYFELALARAEGQNMPQAAFEAGLNIGRIYLIQQAPKKAKQEAKRALRVAESLDNFQAQYQAHQLLADIAEQQNNFAVAFHHHRQFHRFYVSVFNDLRDTKYASLEVRYRTASVQREAALLREKTAELQEEIQERRRVEFALTKAKQAAEVANRAKSRFIANMSHELRTPLNGIMGYAQLLQHDRTLGETHRQQAGIIGDSGSHLLTLINDILDISKLEAKKILLEPKTIHLPSFLNGLTAMVQMNAEQRDLQMRVAFDERLPTLVLADEKRLRQVLLNLLSNAIKFTYEGFVSLDVKVIEPHPTQPLIRFAVRDTGIGIAAKDLKAIFEAFEQAGSNHERRKGTGLGLTISREIVLTMGGEIKANSQVGIGSQFSFELRFPLASQQLDMATEQVLYDVVGYVGERKQLLVVDDDAVSRRFLSDLLTQLGFDIKAFADGKMALLYAEQHPVDVALVDYLMPTMRGDRVAEALKGMRADMKLICVSANAKVLRDDLTATRLFDALLEKPFSRELLLAMLADFLNVEWVFEEEAGEDVSISAEQKTPSEPQLQTYLELAQQGDLLTLSAQLDALVQQDAAYRAFADALRPSLDLFDDEELAEILQRYIANG